MVGTAQCREAGEDTQGSFVMWVCFGRGWTCACVCVRECTRVGVSHACGGAGTLPSMARHRSTCGLKASQHSPAASKVRFLPEELQGALVGFLVFCLFFCSHSGSKFSG